jgi:hypothetical protein
MGRPGLEDSPDEVGNQGEHHDQESGNPDEESGGEFWGFDFLFVHASGYAFDNSCQGGNPKHIQFGKDV